MEDDFAGQEQYEIFLCHCPKVVDWPKEVVEGVLLIILLIPLIPKEDAIE